MADEFTKAALYGIKTFNKKVKEKIGIEKLIELLNERIKEGWEPYGYDYSIAEIDEIWKSDGLYFVSFVGEDYPGPVNLEHLLTKQAGLIKWLVENDKIDKKKLDEAERKPMYITDDMFSLYKIDECVIMLLSISNSPIDDLISYLK